MKETHYCTEGYIDIRVLTERVSDLQTNNNLRTGEILKTIPWLEQKC